MKSSSIYKVPEGKLLKISLEAQDSRIAGIKISGDFFMHPEDAIELLEDKLQGIELIEAKLEEVIGAIIKDNSIQLFGFNPKDLAKAIMMAVEQDEV